VSARPALATEGEHLVAVFTGELATAGLRAWPSTIGGARAFCARSASPERFAAAAVDEQLRLRPHLRQLACWLMVTGRIAMSAEYLARADLRLGAVAGRYHPELHARFAATAEMLGSDKCWVAAQWNTLAQLAALHGATPGAVTASQVHAGGAALLDAFARPDHPKAGHKLRTALVRLRATMFHAGMTDTPPRLPSARHRCRAGGRVGDGGPDVGGDGATLPGPDRAQPAAFHDR